ncbi:MAG: cation-transporting P-type ATPase [Bacteroidia bacterium]|nr:cation-transporting P-type ATPase [Bacteroidia bacterium]MDW8157705.1 cation-transporting P-type ATPase [Bacteroidia bacterium]
MKEGILWHSLNKEEVLSRLKTSLAEGLSEEEVQKRQEQYGKNILTQQKSTSPFILFLLQFHQPLIYILLGATAITLYLGEYLDALVIFGIVFINAVIGFIQEYRALRAISSLAHSMTPEATVIREGKRHRIPAQELTIGDIVWLEPGDKVPADLRLLSIRDLQIDEAPLTGESVPVPKKVTELPHQTLLADRSNMAYSSTLVTYGSGIGAVVAIGNATEIGRINQMIASADILATPLTQSIARFSSLLLYVILGFAILTFIVGVKRGNDIFDMFMASVALAVGAIPEGLPAAITIMLANGVARIAKKNAIIRKLPAVETLGSTTVICSDKTGTLTQNQMTVQEIIAGGWHYTVTGVGYEPIGTFQINGEEACIRENVALEECLIAGLLCNQSNLIEEAGAWKIEGDPTEGALVVAANKAAKYRENYLNLLPLLDTIPFESENQYMATLHKVLDKPYHVIYIKGSVERILERCNLELLPDGQIQEINRQKYFEITNQMAKKGLRLLAFAYKHVPNTQQEITHYEVAQDLIFLGIQAMIDPPRPEAIEAVKICKMAGIKVKMITGDHELTALTIAQKIGIVGATSEQELSQKVINGSKMSSLSDEELIAVTQKVAVFARFAPEDKLRIVRALQANNEIVAMTGDGVNDAPSLRQANIGIAMGITGTAVAIETADMVLTDDNFATIKDAVEEGRGIYDNLIKFITWTLPTNFGEGLVILAAIVANTTLPILPLQLLWINMTTAALLGLTLVFEPKEPGIMERKPRNAQEPILNAVLLTRIVIVGVLLCAAAFGFFYELQEKGRSVEAARTIAVNIFVVGELFYLFNCRVLSSPLYKIDFFSNPILLIGAGAMFLVQLFYTYVPFMNQAFHSEALEFMDWLFIVGVGIFIFWVIEIEKGVRYRVVKKRNSKEKEVLQ